MKLRLLSALLCMGLLGSSAFASDVSYYFAQGSISSTGNGYFTTEVPAKTLIKSVSVNCWTTRSGGDPDDVFVSLQTKGYLNFVNMGRRMTLKSALDQPGETTFRYTSTTTTFIWIEDKFLLNVIASATTSDRVFCNVILTGLTGQDALKLP